jgi:hypothetical protein
MSECSDVCTKKCHTSLWHFFVHTSLHSDISLYTSPYTLTCLCTQVATLWHLFHTQVTSLWHFFVHKWLHSDIFDVCTKKCQSEVTCVWRKCQSVATCVQRNVRVQRRVYKEMSEWSDLFMKKMSECSHLCTKKCHLFHTQVTSLWHFFVHKWLHSDIF